MISNGHRRSQGKAPVVREKFILASCKQILRLMRGAGHLDFVRVSNSGVMRGGGARGIFMTKNPDMAGITDLIIWVKNGAVLCVELKAEDGELSDDQKDFGHRIRRMGHQWHVVRSPSALEELLVANGVPRLTLLPSKG